MMRMGSYLKAILAYIKEICHLSARPILTREAGGCIFDRFDLRILPQGQAPQWTKIPHICPDNDNKCDAFFFSGVRGH